MTTPVPDLEAVHDLESIRSLGTCAVANAIESFGVRLRNEGFTDGSIRAILPHLPPSVGHAVTIRIRCSAPPAVGPNYIEHTSWWDHVLAMPWPRILVIEDVDPMPGTGALVGEVHASILDALGVVAVVTNGSVRDLPAVGAMGFNLFASRVSVSHAYAHLVEIGARVQVGGLAIAPGDLLLGDVHGVVSIPTEIRHRLPAAAQAISRREATLLQVARKRPVSVEELRAAVERAQATR